MLVDFNLIISLFAIYRYIKSTHYAPNFIQHYVSTIVDPGTTGSWVADTPPHTHNVHTAISASKTKELMNASTQRQEAETFWMDSKLKPGFFWFHVLWSLTEHKLSPTILRYVQWKYGYYIYWGGKNPHTSEPMQFKPMFKGQLFTSKTEKISLLHSNTYGKQV